MQPRAPSPEVEALSSDDEDFAAPIDTYAVSSSSGEEEEEPLGTLDKAEEGAGLKTVPSYPPSLSRTSEQPLPALRSESVVKTPSATTTTVKEEELEDAPTSSAMDAAVIDDSESRLETLDEEEADDEETEEELGDDVSSLSPTARPTPPRPRGRLRRASFHPNEDHAVINARVRAEFEKYDTDGSGSISLAEMIAFLDDTFAAAIEHKSVASDIGQISPHTLAKATAHQAFIDVDADGDGELSFAEFEAWFASANGNDSGEETEEVAAAVTPALAQKKPPKPAKRSDDEVAAHQAAMEAARRVEESVAVELELQAQAEEAAALAVENRARAETKATESARRRAEAREAAARIAAERAAAEVTRREEERVVAAEHAAAATASEKAMLRCVELLDSLSTNISSTMTRIDDDRMRRGHAPLSPQR